MAQIRRFAVNSVNLLSFPTGKGSLVIFLSFLFLFFFPSGKFLAVAGFIWTGVFFNRFPQFLAKAGCPHPA